MPDYLQDLDLNSDGDIHTDDGNDLALTSGLDNLEQSININAGNAVEDFIGGNVNGTKIAILEERLTNALDADPQVSSVQDVSLEQFDKQTNSLSLDVLVEENENFTLEVSA